MTMCSFGRKGNRLAISVGSIWSQTGCYEYRWPPSVIDCGSIQKRKKKKRKKREHWPLWVEFAPITWHRSTTLCDSSAVAALGKLAETMAVLHSVGVHHHRIVRLSSSHPQFYTTAGSICFPSTYKLLKKKKKKKRKRQKVSLLSHFQSQSLWLSVCECECECGQ